MSERVYVYNPADDDFDRGSFTYNAHEFALKPNAVNEIVSPWPEISEHTLLKACLAQLETFGVVHVLDASDEAIAVAQARAEALHEAWLRKVHGQTLADFNKDQARLKECGLTPVPMKEAPKKVQRAHAKLVEWGIIAGALLLTLLFTGSVQATETARHNVLSQMFTTNDWFGMPPSSGDPFTCNSGAIRSMYYDTATNTVKFCNGTSWGGLGSSGVTIGTTAITSGTSGRVLFDNAGVVGEDSDFAFVTDTLTVTKLAGTTLTGTNVATGRTTFGSAADAANAVDLGETAGRITFEGTTADANETRFGATDPTVGDQVIMLPDLAAATTDTLVALAATQTLTNKTLTSPTLTTPALGAATGTSVAIPSSGAANAVELGETAGRITFEGATADAFEGRLGWTDPTVGDQVILLPNLAAATTDTLVTLAATQTLTNKTLTSPTMTTPTLGVATATSVDIGSTSTTLSESAGGWLAVEGNNLVKGNTQQITVAGPTAARTYTFPDASATIARTDAANSFTGVQTLLNNGSGGAAILQIGGTSGPGFYTAGSSTVIVTGNGGGSRDVMLFDPSIPRAQMRSDAVLGWTTSTSITGAVDASFTREGAGIIQLDSDAAAPVSYTFKGADSRGGTDTNVAGAGLTLAPGKGTGTGAGTGIALQRSLIGTTGTTQQTLADAEKICESKTLSNTSATLTTLATVAAASNSAGALDASFTVTCTDATNFDADKVRCTVGWVNKGGVITIGTPNCTASVAANNSGSCTVAPTFTTGSSLINVNVTPVIGTIVPTTTTGYVRVMSDGAGAITCQ